ncbi:hypothetical protein FLLO111716_10300 [Flavobacterium longum]
MTLLRVIERGSNPNGFTRRLRSFTGCRASEIQSIIPMTLLRVIERGSNPNGFTCRLRSFTGCHAQRNPVESQSRALALCPKLFLNHEYTNYFSLCEIRDIHGDGNTLSLNDCPREGWKRYPFARPRAKDLVDSPARRDTPNQKAFY